VAPPEGALDKALKMLRNSRRPVIIIGHGARGKTGDILALAAKLQCPVLTTFKGKGLIPDSNPHAGGVLGRSGTPVASWLMNESDLLVVFGASFSNHTGITDKLPTIQVDFDPMALAKFHPVEALVTGEISVTARLMAGKLGKTKAENQLPQIAERWAIWRREKQNRLKELRGKGLGAIHVFDALNRMDPDNAVMCVDVGNNAYSFGRYYESRDNDFLMSGYLGSIGFALPASLGAWAAVKGKRPVVAVAGDGGFAQYMAEMTTLVHYNMDVKIILLNNNELGKISKEQRAGGWPAWKTSLTNPDFAAYARSCGAWGQRACTVEEVEQGMAELFRQKGPALLEVCTDTGLV